MDIIKRKAVAKAKAIVRKSRRSQVLTAFAVCLASPAANAGALTDVLGIQTESFDGAISTDRPSFTSSTTPIASGHVQVEAGFQLTSDTDDFTAPFATVRTGLTPNLELTVGWAGLSITDTAAGNIEGGNDVFVGARTKLSDQQGSVPTVTLIGSVSLPVGDDELSSNSVDPTVGATWTYGLETGGLFGTVLFSTFTDSDDDRFFETDAAIGYGFPLADRTSAYVEYFGLFPGEGDVAHSVNGGLAYQLTNDFQVDAFLGGGLNDAASDIFLGAGLGYRW